MLFWYIIDPIIMHNVDSAPRPMIAKSVDATRKQIAPPIPIDISFISK